jgi:hypothetical protein
VRPPADGTVGLEDGLLGRQVGCRTVSETLISVACYRSFSLAPVNRVATSSRDRTVISGLTPSSSDTVPVRFSQYTVKPNVLAPTTSNPFAERNPTSQHRRAYHTHRIPTPSSRPLTICAAPQRPLESDSTSLTWHNATANVVMMTRIR